MTLSFDQTKKKKIYIGLAKTNKKGSMDQSDLNKIIKIPTADCPSNSSTCKQPTIRMYVKTTLIKFANLKTHRTDQAFTYMCTCTITYIVILLCSDPSLRLTLSSREYRMLARQICPEFTHRMIAQTDITFFIPKFISQAQSENFTF